MSQKRDIILKILCHIGWDTWSNDVTWVFRILKWAIFCKTTWRVWLTSRMKQIKHLHKFQAYKKIKIQILRVTILLHKDFMLNLHNLNYHIHDRSAAYMQSTDLLCYCPQQFRRKKRRTIYIFNTCNHVTESTPTFGNETI